MKFIDLVSLSNLVLLSCLSVGSTENPVENNVSRLNRSKATTMEIDSSRLTRTNTDASRYLENSTSSDGQKPKKSESNESAKKENEESSKTVDPSTIPPQSEMRDDESSSFSVPVLLFALAGIGYLIRKRLINNKMNSGRWIAGAMPLPTDDFDEDEMIHYRKQEMVTISNEEDDWEWEDHAKRDLENGLSGVYHNNGTNIQNELKSAPEINLKSYENNFNSSIALKRPSTSYIRGTSNSSISSVGTGKADKSVFTASSTKIKPTSNVTDSKPYNADSDNDGKDDDDNWDEDDDNWDDHPVATQKVHAHASTPTPSSITSKSDKIEASKPTVTTTSAAIPSIEDLLKEQQLSGNAPVITSLQKSVPESKPKPTTKTKQEEDDIFASLGLSTLPKTTAKTALPVQKSMKVATLTKPPASSAVTSSLSAAALISPESEDAGSDWGDDSDLNDLLDD